MNDDFNDLYILDLLEELKYCDGIFTAVLIHDKKLEKYLEDLNVISTNARGSSFPGENFDKFYRDLWKRYEKN